tara:strand:- start:90 stop:470 length:381 start_codon:yes stop_codon:yes gene_type:complete
MKILLTFFFLFCSSNIFGKDIIDPLSFSGSQSEKNAVISFIERDVKKTYCENELLESMCTNSILRMMEEEELQSFKKLIYAKNKNILNKVINSYCNNSLLESMCSYTIILMMYEEEVTAAGKKLDW